MKLPHGDQAIVDVAKLRDYCLNPQHPTGRHKARVFRAALGFDQAHAEQLRQILERVAAREDAELGEKDDFGQRYRVDFSLPGASGPVRLRSCWIVLKGESAPRLTSCYVVPAKQAGS